VREVFFYNPLFILKSAKNDYNIDIVKKYLESIQIIALKTANICKKAKPVNNGTKQ